MDYNTLAKDCEFRSEIYRMQHDSERLVHEKQCAKSILDLVERAEKAEKIVEEYAESARAIALWLSEYCDKTLSYPSMISNAARKISVAYADIEKRAEQAEKERDDYKELFFAYKHVCGGVEPDRIGELVEAYKSGKCIIAPCALGDTIWFKTYSKNGTICKGVQPHIVKEIRVYAVVDGEYIDCVIPSWTFGESTFLNYEDALKKE